MEIILHTLTHGYLRIDTDTDLDTIHTMLKNNGLEPPARIEGFLGFGNLINNRDGINLFALLDIADFLKSLDDESFEIASHLLNERSINMVKDMIEQNYCGCYPSLEDYLKFYYKEHYDVPKHLFTFVDWYALSEYWEKSLDVIELNNRCYIFNQ